MAGVTAIIAVVALFIGLAAIWLVTDSIGKIEKRTRRMADTQIKALRQSIADLGQAVSDIKAGQEDIRNRVRDVVRNREAADGELAALRRDMDRVTGALSQPTTKQSRRGGT